MSCSFTTSVTVDEATPLPWAATASDAAGMRSATTGQDGSPSTTYRRRHSSFHPRRKNSTACAGDDGLLLKIDQFLAELDRRLRFLNQHGDLPVEGSIPSAFAMLQAVHEQCSSVSGDLIFAGQRKARLLVETVESMYHDALAAKQTLNEKAFWGILLLDDLLSDFEARAHQVRKHGLSTLKDEGWKVMDGGIEQVQKVVDGGLKSAKRAADTVEEHVARAVARAREHGLIRYEDLPIPWRINPHIVKGYRFSESKIECIRSIFDLSNETINIWTHVIGLVLVLAMAFYFYPSSLAFASSTTKADVLIAAVFFFAACKCLVCSCMWHTMNSVADQTLLERFVCVDYTGISFLIAASIMTVEYTAFYCEPVSQAVYLSLTALLGIGGAILPWHPTFNRADLAWARVAFYGSLVLTGAAPVLQLSLTRGAGWAWDFYAPVLKGVGVYALGAAVYATQMPERQWPGMFDYIGGSHNIWHCAVLGGILFHYFAMQDSFSVAFRVAENGCTWV